MYVLCAIDRRASYERAYAYYIRTIVCDHHFRTRDVFDVFIFSSIIPLPQSVLRTRVMYLQRLSCALVEVRKKKIPLLNGTKIALFVESQYSSE